MRCLQISFVIVLFLLTPSVAFAASEPNFSSCLNPQGSVMVSYPSGVHGIVGKTDRYEGSDVVYLNSPDAILQCFCSADGKGIQSNWWEATNLTQQELTSYIVQGYILVPNGNVWGLKNAVYLVKNVEYSCKSANKPSNGSGPSNSSSNPSSSSQGSVAGSSVVQQVGEVLGLAATGNISVIFAWFILAIIFGFLAYRLKKNSRRKTV